MNFFVLTDFKQNGNLFWDVMWKKGVEHLFFFTAEIRVSKLNGQNGELGRLNGQHRGLGMKKYYFDWIFNTENADF